MVQEKYEHMLQKQITQIRIVTRQSALALWQANYVKSQLEQLYPHLLVTLKGVTTQGDKILDRPLTKVGGKGLFVKELEESLIEKTADIAVHSMKDVPVFLPDGLCIPVILKRADPREALVCGRQNSTLGDLVPQSTIGSSSLRRQCQMLALRSDLTFKSLRGNVDTRIRKLENQEYDAIILAAAGLTRLGLEKYISHYFSVDEILPAIGQGALGIECRTEDEAVRALIEPLNDVETALCVSAERSMNRLLGGSCVTPVAGLCVVVGDQLNMKLRLKGLVGDPYGKELLRSEDVEKWDSLDRASAIDLGERVAENLIAQGALKIIEACQKEIVCEY